MYHALNNPQNLYVSNKVSVNRSIVVGWFLISILVALLIAANIYMYIKIRSLDDQVNDQNDQINDLQNQLNALNITGLTQMYLQ